MTKHELVEKAKKQVEDLNKTLQQLGDAGVQADWNALIEQRIGEPSVPVFTFRFMEWL